MDTKWIEKPSPKSMRKGTGWFGQMNRCYLYEHKYCVMTRELTTKWGNVIHAAFRNTEGTDISWKEKQWIKDSLFGEDKTAIEVFPSKDRLVDAVNMYHLWIFKDRKFELPFGIHDDDVSERRSNAGLVEFEDFCRYLTTEELEMGQTLPIRIY